MPDSYKVCFRSPWEFLNKRKSSQFRECRNGDVEKWGDLQVRARNRVVGLCMLSPGPVLCPWTALLLPVAGGYWPSEPPTCPAVGKVMSYPSLVCSGPGGCVAPRPLGSRWVWSSVQKSFLGGKWCLDFFIPARDCLFWSISVFLLSTYAVWEGIGCVICRVSAVYQSGFTVNVLDFWCEKEVSLSCKLDLLKSNTW